MKPRRIPTYGLTDYSDSMGEADGIYVGRFEEITERLPNRLRLHRHDYFEAFCLEGNGSHFNDFQVYPIRETTLIFVSPGQVHRWANANQLRGFSLCFTQDFFDGDVPPPSPLLKHTFWFSHELPPALTLSPLVSGEIKALFAEIEREFTNKSIGFEDAMRALIRVLFVRTDRLYAESHETTIPQRSSILVRDFRIALEHHFRTTQAVSDYAKLLNVSADHLSHVVHEQTGRQAGEIIRRRILLEAKRLLAHTEMNISEVAYALTFQDPAYFSRYFRRLTGQSPGEFRENAGGSES